MKKSLAETENEIKKSYDEWNQEKENKLINNNSKILKLSTNMLNQKVKLNLG